MSLEVFIPSFVTLFVVMDPIGLTPIFMALTRGMTPKQRRGIALRAGAVAATILTIFTFFGEQVLSFLGISMGAFRVSGGILLFLIALEMLFEKRTQRRKDQSHEPQPHDDPSVFPLAMPLIAGPGAIATVILLAGQGTDFQGVYLAISTMLVVLSITISLFFISGFLEKLLGETGIKVVTRLLGMLLAALAVQFVLDGLKSFVIL